jgi:hypothetical protein
MKMLGGRLQRGGLWRKAPRGIAVVVFGAVVGIFGGRGWAQGVGTGQVATQNMSGTVLGTVTDAGGALVPKAQVTLTPEGTDGVPGMPLVVTTDGLGSFKFAAVPVGRFGLTISAVGFQGVTTEGSVLAGQHDELAAIALQVGGTSTDVEVTLTQVEMAQEDVRAEEHQKVFGIVPNFFVVYKQNPPPLDAKQKLELAARGTVDPFSFAISAVVAGVEQADDALPGYHQGWEGYGKRYGATYVNFASATMLRDGLFPAIFRQDPRYYYRGTGTKTSRALYALSTAVISRGDNGRRQINISGMLGNFSAAALTQLYYPPGSRKGSVTTVENGALATVGVGVGHVLQEFIFDKITKKTGNRK